jgi:MFS family permease
MQGRSSSGDTDRVPVERSPSDRLVVLAVTFAFQVSLGVATVAIPLLALEVGYDAAAVGYLAATSAAAQLASRLALPRLLARFADRSLIALAAALMFSGVSLLLASTAMPIFVLAQLLQGAARGIFWTAGQAHAIRSGGTPVARLVELNAAGHAGTLVGPALAGSLATIGLPVAIGAAIAGAATSLVGARLLARLPVYDRKLGSGTIGILRRPGLGLASWASVVGGAWWSMIGSYVPVILVSAGLGPQSIGWLVTGSEGAGTIALVAIRRMSESRIRHGVGIGAGITIIALVGIALAPPVILVYAGFLLAGGAAAGSVTALAPALASSSVTEHEQGDALAVLGAFRAVSLLASPAAVGSLLGVTGLPVAVVAVAVALGASSVLVGRVISATPVGVSDQVKH